MSKIIGGDIFAVMKRARDEGLLSSVDSLVAQCSGRGKGSSALDLLIEAAPGGDGGGGDGGKRHPFKLSTRLYLLVDGNVAVSMARVEVYSSRNACDGAKGIKAGDMVGVVSAVVTDKKHRRKGFARDTMKSVLADTHPMNLRLEAVGAAKELYRSVGFSQTGSKMVMKNRKKEWWMID
jgi:GNAT superfamily N-acetyltransferase